MEISEFTDEQITKEHRRREREKEKIRRQERYEKYRRDVAAHDARFLAQAQEIIPGMNADQFDRLASVFASYWEESP